MAADTGPPGMLPGSPVAPPDAARPLDTYDFPALMARQGAPSWFHILIKPVGSACNLDCTYCFYLSKASLAAGPGPGRMSDATLEEFIRKYIEGVNGPEVVFSWQGGEPTLLGVDFFRRAVALQRKHAKPRQKVQNDLQTNGTLLDDEWCRFLKENNFLVGLSIDGPKKLHDAYRVARDESPTFDRVFAAGTSAKCWSITSRHSWRITWASRHRHACTARSVTRPSPSNTMAASTVAITASIQNTPSGAFTKRGWRTWSTLGLK